MVRDLNISPWRIGSPGLCATTVRHSVSAVLGPSYNESLVLIEVDPDWDIQSQVRSRLLACHQQSAKSPRHFLRFRGHGRAARGSTGAARFKMPQTFQDEAQSAQAEVDQGQVVDGSLRRKNTDTHGLAKQNSLGWHWWKNHVQD